MLIAGREFARDCRSVSWQNRGSLPKIIGDPEPERHDTQTGPVLQRDDMDWLRTCAGTDFFAISQPDSTTESSRDSSIESDYLKRGNGVRDPHRRNPDQRWRCPGVGTTVCAR